MVEWSQNEKIELRFTFGQFSINLRVRYTVRIGCQNHRLINGKNQFYFDQFIPFGEEFNETFRIGFAIVAMDSLFFVERSVASCIHTQTLTIRFFSSIFHFSYSIDLWRINVAECCWRFFFYLWLNLWCDIRLCASTVVAPNGTKINCCNFTNVSRFTESSLWIPRMCVLYDWPNACSEI